MDSSKNLGSESNFPMRSKIYFTSDAHLGSRHHADPMAVERRLAAWLERIRHEAKAIYFMGDMFDYWFEYRYVVPRGFTRFLGKVAELSDEGVEIHFFAGNHDVWLTDYLTKELGAHVHMHGITVELSGKLFRLAHGDEEYRSVKRSYDCMYRLFRNPLARLLYAAVHPRWTVGLAYGISLKSRRSGEKRKTPHAYSNDYFDIENEWLIRFAKEHNARHPEVDFYIFGHRHLLVDMALRDEKRVLILGDWIRYNSYAVWDGTTLVLESMEDME